MSSCQIFQISPPNFCLNSVDREEVQASNRATVWVAHNLIRLIGFQVAEVQLFKSLCYLHFSVFSLFVCVCVCVCVSLSVISSMFPSSAGIQFLQQLFNQRLSWSSFVFNLLQQFEPYLIFWMRLPSSSDAQIFF